MEHSVSLPYSPRTSYSEINEIRYSVRSVYTSFLQLSVISVYVSILSAGGNLKSWKLWLLVNS